MTDATKRFENGASWTTVSANVRRLVQEWEGAGTIAGSRPPTRKEAIRLAVTLSLREAERARSGSAGRGR
jgi:hypothetical protein